MANRADGHAANGMWFERQRCRLVGISEQSAITRQMDRQREHRPLEVTGRQRPQPGGDAGGQVVVSEVVKMVIDGGDSSALCAAERDRSWYVAHKVDCDERREKSPPVHLARMQGNSCR